MNTTNGPIPELVDEAGGLALLAGADVHDDISYAKYKVLCAVQKTDRMAIGNLGRAVGSATSTTSEIVTRLAKTGLVTKTRNVYDGRVVTVELSDRGRQAVERYRRRIHEGYVSLFTGMSPVERDTFLSALKQLDALLQKGTE